jgi:EC042_2821-lke REase/Protein of unknown function (DUF3644)
VTQRLKQKQRALFDLLKSRHGGIVTEAEVLKATGWKPTSWRVYVNNGLYAAYIRETAPGEFRVRINANTTEDEFRRAGTQTKRDNAFKDPLAQALVRRSRDNMVLALEVYNRPSLTNRLDAFSMLFTTGWEQLLKAELIEQSGEAMIFRPKKPGQRRESIGLAECLERVFPQANDPTRRNIERIAELRHAATHLVMPELQPVYAQLFQAGVIEYARRLLEKTGDTLLARQNIGLLALAAAEESLDAAPLSRLYGDELANEITDQAKTIADEIESVNDGRFAIRLECTFRFATGSDKADVTLVRAAEAPRSAVVVEKPVDPERTHPLRSTQVIEEVSARLKVRFSSHDLRAVLFKMGWKKGDNEHHRLQRNPDTPKFSHKAVDAIVEAVEDDPVFLSRARESLRHHDAHARSGNRVRRRRPQATPHPRLQHFSKTGEQS